MREESLVRGAVRLNPLAQNLKENVMSVGTSLLIVLILMLISPIPAFQRLLARLLQKAPVGKVLRGSLRDEGAAAPGRSASGLRA